MSLLFFIGSVVLIASLFFGPFGLIVTTLFMAATFPTHTFILFLLVIAAAWLGRKVNDWFYAKGWPSIKRFNSKHRKH